MRLEPLVLVCSALGGSRVRALLSGLLPALEEEARELLESLERAADADRHAWWLRVFRPRPSRPPTTWDIPGRLGEQVRARLGEGSPVLAEVSPAPWVRWAARLALERREEDPLLRPVGGRHIPASGPSRGGHAQLIRPGPSFALALDVLALAPTQRPLDLARWPGRRVCRVEPLLARRSKLIAELRALVAASAAALSESLATPVSCGVALRSSPADPRRELGTPRAHCLFHLEGLGAAAVLELELRLVVGLVAQLAGAPSPTTPVLALTAFEQAVLGHLILVALAGLRTQPAAEERWRPRLVGIASSRHEAVASLGGRRLLGVDLDFRAGDHGGRLGFLLPEAAVRTLARGIDEDPPRSSGAARAARFRFGPRILCGVLWQPELRALQPATAVTLPVMRWVDDQLRGPLELRRAGTVLEGQLTGEGWTLRTIDLRRMTEVTCVDPQLSTLPVELEVELASVPLTLGELAALAPGTVVPLRISAGDPVFLRAGDRRVARAELVDLEGEVAARVLDLLE